MAPTSSELRVAIAARLKAARIAYDPHLTKAALARKCGIAKQTMHDYEAGRTYPSAAFLVCFHELTGCSLDWIFLGKITPSMPPELAQRIGLTAPELIVW